MLKPKAMAKRLALIDQAVRFHHEQMSMLLSAHGDNVPDAQTELLMASMTALSAIYKIQKSEIKDTATLNKFLADELEVVYTNATIYALEQENLND